MDKYSEPDPLISQLVSTFPALQQVMPLLGFLNTTGIAGTDFKIPNNLLSVIPAARYLFSQADRNTLSEVMAPASEVEEEWRRKVAKGFAQKFMGVTDPEELEDIAANRVSVPRIAATLLTHVTGHNDIINSVEVAMRNMGTYSGMIEERKNKLMSLSSNLMMETLDPDSSNQFGYWSPSEAARALPGMVRNGMLGDVLNNEQYWTPAGDLTDIGKETINDSWSEVSKTLSLAQQVGLTSGDPSTAMDEMSTLFGRDGMNIKNMSDLNQSLIQLDVTRQLTGIDKNQMQQLFTQMPNKDRFSSAENVGVMKTALALRDAAKKNMGDASPQALNNLSLRVAQDIQERSGTVYSGTYAALSERFGKDKAEEYMGQILDRMDTHTSLQDVQKDIKDITGLSYTEDAIKAFSESPAARLYRSRADYAVGQSERYRRLFAKQQKSLLKQMGLPSEVFKGIGEYEPLTKEDFKQRISNLPSQQQAQAESKFQHAMNNLAKHHRTTSQAIQDFWTTVPGLGSQKSDLQSFEDQVNRRASKWQDIEGQFGERGAVQPGGITGVYKNLMDPGATASDVIKGFIPTLSEEDSAKYKDIIQDTFNNQS